MSDEPRAWRHLARRVPGLLLHRRYAQLTRQCAVGGKVEHIVRTIEIEQPMVRQFAKQQAVAECLLLNDVVSFSAASSAWGCGGLRAAGGNTIRTRVMRSAHHPPQLAIEKKRQF